MIRGVAASWVEASGFSDILEPFLHSGSFRDELITQCVKEWMGVNPGEFRYLTVSRPHEEPFKVRVCGGKPGTESGDAPPSPHTIEYRVAHE